MTTHLSRIAVLAAARETTPGTAVAPTIPDDANFLIYDPQVSWDLQMTARNPVHTKLSKLRSIPGGAMARITFRCEMKGSGTAGTEPRLGLLLKACGLDEIVVASTSVTYAPDDEGFNSASTDPQTLTMDFYQHNRRFRIIGAMGNCRITARSGEPAMLEFEFSGVVDPTDPLTDDDTESLAGITYESTLPPAFMGASTVTFLGTTPMTTQWELDFGNVVTVIPSANAAHGYAHSRIVDRGPNGSLDVDAVEQATYSNSTHGAWEAGSVGAMSIVIGSTAGNIATISTASRTQITNAQPQDRDGIVVDQVSYLISQNADSDSEFSIAFT